MDLVKINEDLAVVNQNKVWLEEVRRTNDTLDNGAMLIVDGLKEYISNQLGRYEEDDDVPYERLFKALKAIIYTASENDVIRNSIMSGDITELKNEPVIKTAIITKEIASIKNGLEQVNRNVQAISNFAHNHTLGEIAKKYKFCTNEVCRTWLNAHKIDYKRVRKPSTYDVEKLKELAKVMKPIDIARVLGISKVAVHYALNKYQIDYLGKRKEHSKGRVIMKNGELHYENE